MVKTINFFNNFNQAQHCPITVPLVIHRVVKSSPNLFEDIDENTFISILQYIAERRVGLENSVDHRDKRSRNWLLTIDDGYSSDYEIVFPALQDAKVNAVFFITTGKIGSPGYLSWEQVREMRRYGMEFGSHGQTHAKMTELTKRQAIQEFLSSRRNIEDHLGEQVTAFSFPYGYYNAGLVELAFGAGYSVCCVSDHGTVKLPAKIIPRNSINGTMRWPAIIRTLEPSTFVTLKWATEDWAKKRAKRVLSDAAYLSLRSLISRIRS